MWCDVLVFFFQAEDGIRDVAVTGVQTCALPICMELLSFSQVLFNPVAQAKFVHTVAAGYVVGSVFVLAVSAWYLLRGRNVDIAKRSMAVAASFGLACALSGAGLGGESGDLASGNQKMKIAAVEAERRGDRRRGS